MIQSSGPHFGIVTHPYFDSKYESHRTIRNDKHYGHKTSPHFIYNKSSCMPTVGRIGATIGASLVVGDVIAPRLHLIDIENKLLNRDVGPSRTIGGGVSDLDVKKIKLNDVNPCGKFSNESFTRLTQPPILHREVAIDRFYDLLDDPQSHIYDSVARNTRLEARDNWFPQVDCPFPDSMQYPQQKRPNCRKTEGKICGYLL